MDEKIFKLKVIEKTPEIVENIPKTSTQESVLHANQTNPIYKKLMLFRNAKIGDKWSIKDLLR